MAASENPPALETPGARDALGPHGIPLVKHAEAGGEQARDVLALLQHAAATA